MDNWFLLLDKATVYLIFGTLFANVRHELVNLRVEIKLEHYWLVFYDFLET